MVNDDVNEFKFTIYKKNNQLVQIWITNNQTPSSINVDVGEHDEGEWIIRWLLLSQCYNCDVRLRIDAIEQTQNYPLFNRRDLHSVLHYQCKRHGNSMDNIDL